MTSSNCDCSSSKVPKIFSIDDLFEPISMLNKSHAHEICELNSVVIKNKVKIYKNCLVTKIITKNKTDDDILELLDELIQEHKEQGNLRKIESLEKKLINNLDETSYLELIKLKNQLNRD